MSDNPMYDDNPDDINIQEIKDVNCPKAKIPWGWIILINFLFFIIIIVIVVIIIYMIIKNLYKDLFKIEGNFNVNLETYCKSIDSSSGISSDFLDPSKYANMNGYSQDLSIDLMKLCNITSMINCQVVLNKTVSDATILTYLGNRFTSMTRFVITTGTAAVTYGVVYYSTNLVAIVWLGSLVGQQWVTDVQFEQVPSTGINNVTGNVHKGFYDVYTQFSTQIRNVVSNLTPAQSIIVTGHSLGGALSTLNYIDVIDLTTQPLYHCSFASPRVGNPEFAQSYNAAALNSVRVFNTEDIIPDLPLPELGSIIYEHVTGLGVVPFTENLGTVGQNHVNAYLDFMPACPLIVPPCLT